MVQTYDLPEFTQSKLIDARANDFVRLVSCLGDYGNRLGGSAARALSDDLDRLHAAEEFVTRWPRSLSVDVMTKAMDYRHKAATNPGTTLEPSWAAPLASVRPLMEAFVDVARPASLIGKLMALASRVPFNVSVPAATSGGTYRWVGQGAPKPVGNMQLSSVTLPPAKASGILIVTNELMKLSAPASVAVLRREMINGMATYLDDQFTDPTIAAVPNVSPASITNGAPSIGSAGTSAANAATDIKALIAAFIAANPNAAAMVMLMSPAVAVAMAIATGSQTLGANGGRLFGVDVLTGAIGSRIVILDPTALLIADDGDLNISVARHATVEMDSAPTSPPTTGTITISLWQSNLSGLLLDRFINYKMARANAVIYTNQVWV